MATMTTMATLTKVVVTVKMTTVVTVKMTTVVTVKMTTVVITMRDDGHAI
jgi:hypothetical protein